MFIDVYIYLYNLPPFCVQDGNRKECCDIIQPIGMDSMAIKLRTCMKHEIIAWEKKIVIKYYNMNIRYIKKLSSLIIYIIFLRLWRIFLSAISKSYSHSSPALLSSDYEDFFRRKNWLYEENIYCFSSR